MPNNPENPVFSGNSDSFIAYLYCLAVIKLVFPMKEEFLHYLWKYRLYDNDKLSDKDGNRITVIHPGEYNRDSGPDFFNARVIIGDTEWAGNVEIHTMASHFDLHRHHCDPAYDNVILHVVACNDKKVYNTRGEELLTVEMKYDAALYERYMDLVNTPYIIACQSDIKSIESFRMQEWLEALVIERLMDKCIHVNKIFSETGNDWEETFYRLISRYFGFRVNTEPFEMVANVLPYRIIKKHADNLFQVEALLFGAAGMLDEALFREALHDDYYRALIKEFRILSSKYCIHPVHGWLWKYSRLRPANFPTVRLSQLAAMLVKYPSLFSRALEVQEITDLRFIFDVTASTYWNDHYVFGRRSRSVSKTTGNQAIDILLINAVIPVLFFYGRNHDSDDICDKSLSFLRGIGPESNSIIKEWNVTGIDATSAYYTQGLIQLRNNYCRKRRCLECRIGNLLISRGKTLMNNNQLILEP